MQHNKVFVYGTLLEGEHNHSLMNGAQCLDGVRLDGAKMFDVGYFPCIVDSGNPHQTVYGELYEISDETLMVLDDLESEGRMYERREVTVVSCEPDSTEKTTAWAYFWLRGSTHRMSPIDSGQWRLHHTAKKMKGSVR